MQLKQELQYAIEVARGAGRIILEHYGKVARLTKTHVTTSMEAVTDADRASQRFIVGELRRRFPNDGIVGEESDTGDSITFECPEPRGRVWVIDPIDGTNNFISGLGVFAVCIGLLQDGMPVLGVVYDVTRDIVYSAAKGEGAWQDDKPIQSPQTDMSDSSMLMMSSNIIDAIGNCPKWAHRWVGQTTWKLRVLGCAGIEAIMVAAGIAHGAITVNGKLWDVAAPAAILLESGGLITDPRGKPIFPFDLNRYQGAKVPFLAAGPKAHATLLREITENP